MACATAWTNVEISSGSSFGQLLLAHVKLAWVLEPERQTVLMLQLLAGWALMVVETEVADQKLAGTMLQLRLMPMKGLRKRRGLG